MKAKGLDGDFFQALVLFQVRAVAFVATAKEEDRARRAKAVTEALEKLPVPGFSGFHAKVAAADYGCEDDWVLCHGVCMPSCQLEYSAQNLPAGPGDPAR